MSRVDGMTAPTLQRSWPLLVCLLTLAGLPQTSTGFEIATHAALTREAFYRSLLSLPPAPQTKSLFGILGIDTSITDLGEMYIDIGKTKITARMANPPKYEDFAKTVIRKANYWDGKKPGLPTVAGWIMLGAIREDDVKADSGEELTHPQDDPDSPFNRVYNHFFDPVRNVPLWGISTFYTAADWAIYPDSGATLPRQNRYGIPNAREAMWRALTLTRGDGVTELGIAVTEGIYTKESMRRAYWATSFRSLGDVLHLLQDMAQPQHTRDDAHAGAVCIGDQCATGHASYFEKYIDARVTGLNRIVLRDRVPTDAEPHIVRVVPLNYGGYPGQPTAYSLPRTDNYRDFFSTVTGPASTTGRGLANYSNQGFYTFGTNIGSSGAARYTSPSPNGEGLVRSIIWPGSAINAAGEPLQDAVVLMKGNVVDYANSGQGSEASVALSTVGFFDEFLQPKGKVHFSLNHYNYADQARLLIPRAVAYSAGLIDFFFRGRLEFAPQTDGGIYAIADQTLQGCKDTCGFDKIKLRARNATPNDALSGGMFVAVVKFRRNICYTDDLSGMPGGTGFAGYPCRGDEEEIVVSAPVHSPGLDKTNWEPLEFRFPKRIPINATEVQLQLVFRGVLGTEQDAVVVETHDIGEPTFFGFANISDYWYVGARKAFDPYPAGASITESDVRIHFGDVASPVVAVLPKLKATEHAQFAVLAEKGRLLYTKEFVSSAGTAGSPHSDIGSASEFFWQPASQGFQANLEVARARGVYRQHYNFFYYPGDTYYDCQSHVEFCAQTTMTPLSSANRKAFDIVF